MRLLLQLGTALALVSSAFAQEPEKSRYPPPELGPDYKPPATSFPPVRELLPPLADVLVLVLAIAAASYLAHRRRSRTGLLTLAGLSLLWFGFLREGCICAVGSTQNVVEAIADPSAPILISTILIFVIPLIAALLFGRTFCAAVCPLGAIQEVVLLRPMTVPRWLAAGLGILPHVYLALAVLFAATGSGYLICRYDPFVGLFRFGGTANMLVVGACLVFVSIFIGRPYCRFLCPYGVLLGWASSLSKKRITITPTECADCRLCEGACPYDAITEPNAGRAKADRFRGRGALIGMLLLLPFLVVGLGWAGSRLGPELARGNARVVLAEQVAGEDAGLLRETTDASDVFRSSGETVEALQADATALREDFVLGGWLGGGFLGLVIALRLVALSVRRTRRDYEADRQHCYACGRCYQWCPVELERRATGTAPEVRR